jgi:hypothetical protein
MIDHYAEGLEAKENISGEIELDAHKPEIPLSLHDVLEKMASDAKSDPQFAAKEHYIHFKLNAHKALIKADFNDSPEFWIMNLDGGPKKALEGEMRLLSQFGQCHDMYYIKLKERLTKIDESVTGVHSVFPQQNTLKLALDELAQQKRGQIEQKKTEPVRGVGNFTKISPTLFSQKEEKIGAQESKRDAENKQEIKPK